MWPEQLRTCVSRRGNETRAVDRRKAVSGLPSEGTEWLVGFDPSRLISFKARKNSSEIH